MHVKCFAFEHMGGYIVIGKIFCNLNIGLILLYGIMELYGVNNLNRTRDTDMYRKYGIAILNTRYHILSVGGP